MAVHYLEPINVAVKNTKKKKDQRIPRKVKNDPEGNTNQDKNSYIGNVAKRP